MKSFIMAAISALAAAFQSEDYFRFQQYLAQYGKSYNTMQEYELRLAQFLINDAFIT